MVRRSLLVILMMLGSISFALNACGQPNAAQQREQKAVEQANPIEQKTDQVQQSVQQSEQRINQAEQQAEPKQ